MRHGGNQKILFFGLPQQLRNDFDLLPPRLEIRQWNSGDSGHLHVVDDAHQLVEQPDGQVRVLEAVDGQAATGLSVPVLQVRDDAVVHVLLLLLLGFERRK